MLGKQIKALREAGNISQVRLAEELHVSKQSVSNWENGNILPSIEMLVKIARTFSVSTDYLLGLDDRQFLEVSGLSRTELTHVQALINDIRGKKENP